MKLFNVALVVLAIAANVSAQQLVDVPDLARDEITRRGNLATHTQERTGGTQAFTEATALPADDSHKWFLTFITTPDCPHSARLKADLTESPLKAWADPREAVKSWSHFHEYTAGDETQDWRWKQIKVGGYPTVLIQPPISGQYGDPATVVFQQTGYDGDAEKLSGNMTEAIRRYVASLSRQRTYRGGAEQLNPSGAGQPLVGVEPPFTPAPAVNPTPQPNIYPTPYPTVPPTPLVQPTTGPSLGGMLAALLSGMLGSTGLQTFVLVAILVLSGIRTFRKVTGQPLLVDDASFDALKKTLSDLVKETKPNDPSDRSSAG